MWLPVAKCLHTALEANNSGLNIHLFSSLAHQSPDTVVCNEVHNDFFAYHRRRFAAQDIHPHGRLDVAEKQLDIPPLEVKSGKLFSRILYGIKQGGDDVEFLSSEARIFHSYFDLAQGQLLR